MVALSLALSVEADSICLLCFPVRKARGLQARLGQQTFKPNELFPVTPNASSSQSHPREGAPVLSSFWRAAG